MPVRQEMSAGGDAYAAGRDPHVRHLHLTVSGSRGMQVGDGNTQVNNYFLGENLTGPESAAPEGGARAGRLLSEMADPFALGVRRPAEPAGLAGERRPEPPGMPVRLAPRLPVLAGRELLLADLASRLVPGLGQTGPRMAVLCGLGGAGKTSVAVEFAYRQLGRAGMCWQFQAEDPVALAAQFAVLAAQLGMRDLADARDPVAAVHAVLARMTAGWLMIFDNVPDLASVQDFLPPAGSGRVLITSQSQHWPGGWALQVPVLNPEAAAEFIAVRTGDGNLSAARELAGELGGLPLALEQAAAYMQVLDRSIGEYLALFRQRRTDLLARGEPAGYGKAVATTWSLAFEELRQAHPSAIALLRLLACCAPDAIPFRLLLQPRPGLAEKLGPDMTAVLASLLDDPLAADDAIRELLRYSLISSPRGGSVSVHRLVQAVTLRPLSADQAQAWRQAAAALIEAALPGEAAEPWPAYCVQADAARQPPDAWPAFAALLPHVQAALSPDRDGMASIANYLLESGSLGAARELQRQIAAAREQLLGAEHPGTLAARIDLADYTGLAGDAAAARDQFAELLPVTAQVLGAGDPHVLIARMSAFRWAVDAGDATAIDLLAEELTVLERVLGAQHPTTLLALFHLARLTGFPGGAAAAARDQFAELLPVMEQVLGPQHRITLFSRSWLAHWTGQAMDELDKATGRTAYAAAARDQLSELVPALEQNLGSDHRETLAHRAQLARWTGVAGNPAAGRDQLAELVPVMERVLGAEDELSLFARVSLAELVGDAGDGGAAAARDLLAELLPVWERVSGPEHPQTLYVRMCLAHWTGEAGDAAAARGQFAGLLPVVSRLLGGEHPTAVGTSIGLSRWSGAAQEPATARDLYTALIPVCQKILGPEHQKTLDLRAKAAKWSGAAGDATAARAQYDALLPIRERVQGPENPDTLATRAELAYWTGFAGDPAAARDQYAALLPALERASGPEHRDTLFARVNLAVWTGAAGNARAAHDGFARVLPLFERVLGVEDPDSLTLRLMLAESTGKAGDAAAARDQLAALLPVQERVSGPQHAATVSVLDQLAYWTEKAR